MEREDSTSRVNGSAQGLKRIPKENEDLRSQLRDQSFVAEKPGPTSQEALITLQMLHAAQAAYSKLQTEASRLKQINDDQTHKIEQLQYTITELKTVIEENVGEFDESQKPRKIPEEEFRSLQETLAKAQLEKAEIYNRYYDLQADDTNMRAFLEIATMALYTIRMSVETNGFDLQLPENYSSLWEPQPLNEIVKNIKDPQRYKVFEEFDAQLQLFVGDSMTITQNLYDLQQKTTEKSGDDKEIQVDLTSADEEKINELLENAIKVRDETELKFIEAQKVITEKLCAIENKTHENEGLKSRISSLEADISRLTEERKTIEEKKQMTPSFFEEYVELKREVARLKALLAEQKTKTRTRGTADSETHSEIPGSRSRTTTPDAVNASTSLPPSFPNERSRISLPTPVGKVISSTSKYPTLHLSEGLPLLPQARR